MGRIRVLADQVANQIAAGEVVDRPASVAKELLENALDAGAKRIRVEVEAGGRRLVRVTDDGEGMSRDDALLAFERHATSKLRTADDLLSISTLGFRGEALPSIASVARVTLETAAAPEKEGTVAGVGTRVQIAGGKILSVEDAALPRGTTIAVADLFFNTPARRKFLRAESTELAHVTALVTHYALAHPEKHLELLSSSHTIVLAPPVARTAERIYQIFGKDTLEQLLPVAAELRLEHAGLPEPPPWKRSPDQPKREPGALRLTGFYSKPELQKLNRNSIYIFVNKRLIRDRLLLHAITEAYRNVIPHTSYPVVLLFLEMPPEEVDVNVHPAKTEVRFRQQGHVHDFVRDSLRNALIKARPAAGFLASLGSEPSASPSLMPPPASHLPGPPRPDPGTWDGLPGPPRIGQGSLPGSSEQNSDQNLEQWGGLPDSDPAGPAHEGAEPFSLTPRQAEPAAVRLPFAEHSMGPSGIGQGFAPGFDQKVWGETAKALFEPAAGGRQGGCNPAQGKNGDQETVAATALIEVEQSAANLSQLANLRPLGQLRGSFILAAGQDGLWIIDQHVAHERVLFEKILRERQSQMMERQRLLMPLLVDLKPDQMAVFASIAEELERNGFEVELFGPQTIAIREAPAGLEGAGLERALVEIVEQTALDPEKAYPNQSLTRLKERIAASVACHAAIKVNTPLDPERIEWLLSELAKTSHPTSCPHGRPIALLYSWREIDRAFHRI
jgi:DNA mismatch repair protein MutL